MCQEQTAAQGPTAPGPGGVQPRLEPGPRSVHVLCPLGGHTHTGSRPCTDREAGHLPQEARQALRKEFRRHLPISSGPGSAPGPGTLLFCLCCSIDLVPFPLTAGRSHDTRRPPDHGMASQPGFQNLFFLRETKS